MRADAAGVAPRTLGRLRLRLTAWYVGTLVLILLLLGVGLFATITRRFDAELDQSLQSATTSISAAMRERHEGGDRVELLIPDRELAVFDSAGQSITGASSAWLRRFAIHAAASGASAENHRVEPERILRAYARPFRDANGRLLVAVAVADEVELEDKYAALIAATGVAALLALLLVAAGGWIVARQSTEPIERAIAHMRRFMADAAHELRTPLTVLRTRADVALQRPRSAVEYEAALRAVEHEASRMGRIVEDLLTLARADAGERPIERQRIFLDDVTLEAAGSARALAERRGVRLSLEDFEEAPVTGDPALLRQLVMILLDNAIKFSHENGVVGLAIRTVNGASVLSVSDHGVGIPVDQIPNVFERFYRGDTARTRGATAFSEGAGLGLSIAQWIVEEHNAVIRLTSELGKGTRVVVQFPSLEVGL